MKAQYDTNQQPVLTAHRTTADGHKGDQMAARLERCAAGS